MKLRKQIKGFLGIKIYKESVDYKVIERKKFKTFERQLIKYKGTENDDIPAYLFLPLKVKIIGAVLVHHQHNGERHLGKSEVSGIAGDPYQFFCEALCQQGIITLAPDSICFEDRRSNKKGIEPAKEEDDDILQHYNEMCYRLLRQDLLMKKVVEDSSIGISLLKNIKDCPVKKIGMLGHSYGGNTAIFHPALDKRIKYICTSGAVCSYKTKIKEGTGIELAEVIPGFLKKYDIPDLINSICPRHLLILSADEDIYARDARQIAQKVKKKYKKLGKAKNLVFKQYKGGHPLTQKRFDDIINWFVKQMAQE